MDFDFEALEEADPSGPMSMLLSQLRDEAERLDGLKGATRPLPESKMRSLRYRIGRAASERGFQDLGAAVAEALWDPQELAARVPRVARDLLGVLKETVAAKPVDLEAGAALVHTLWMLSLSTSLQEVRVHRPPSRAGAPCALVLGFGGSGVEDLEGQAAYYQSIGFATLCTTRLTHPAVLSQRQDELLATELRQALAGGCPGLVLHMCSHHGVSYGSLILHKWLAGVPPFDGLPPLARTLRALVFDCGPAPDFDPATGCITYPTDAEGMANYMAHLVAPLPTHIQQGLEQPKVETAVEKAHTRLYKMVILGCVGALSKRWQTENLEDLIAKDVDVMKCIAEATRNLRAPPPWMALACGNGNCLKDPIFMLHFLELHIKVSVPRLFLYSNCDATVVPERMEAYIKHVKAYNEAAAVFQLKVAKPTHCRLWDSESAACGAAVSELLEAAGLLNDTARGG